MLALIGLGLGSPKDITIKGKEVLSKCDIIFLESYTSLFVQYSVDDGQNGLQNLCAFLEIDENKVCLADRILVEQECEEKIIQPSKTQNVAILVIGDPFGATTHADLYLRAKKLNVDVQVVHNASIMNAIGCTGLQLYRFGETVSLCFWTETWKPTSAFEKIIKNYNNGLHTLCLLDIKVKEQSIENMMRGRRVFEPPRFMSASEAAGQIIESINLIKSGGDANELSVQLDNFNENTLCVGVARIGAIDQKVVCCSLKEISNCGDILGQPLHSLIIPAKDLHDLEQEMLDLFRI